MYKCMYLLWETAQRPLGGNRAILLEQCAPALLELGLVGLSINVDDEYSTVKSPAPKCYSGPAICATLSVWVASLDCCAEVEAIVQRGGYTLAGYLVDESIYKDYGDNGHSGVRNWPDGQRSPCVLAVTLLTKPKRFSHDKWIKRWHGRMSPISEKIQPRQRYVRNVVLRPLTPDALPFDGIVEEAWPSAEHISNPYLFYCASSRWQLFKHLLMMLYAIFQFHNILKFRTTTMSEYFIRSGAVIKDGCDVSDEGDASG